MSGMHLISLITNIVLGILLVSLVLKDRIYSKIRKIKDNRRETGRQRIRQVVEEVLREIVKDDI